jgi:oligopeptidase A
VTTAAELVDIGLPYGSVPAFFKDNLLMSAPHPFLESDFAIRWSALTPDRIVPDTKEALSLAADGIEKLCGLSGAELTFEKVLLGYEDALRPLNFAWGKVCHLDSVMNSPALREAYNAMLPEVSAFFTGLTLNARLWAVIKAYAATPEAKALTAVRKRFLDETVAEFVENGADLAPDAKTRLEVINADLAQITQKFSENVLDSTNAWEHVVTDEAVLAGLPESARAAALQNAKAKGLASDEKPAWRFTLNAPSWIPVMRFADNEALRKTIRDGIATIGASGDYDNKSNVAKILTLRDEKARLLGKATFADFTTARRMAKSGAAALAFVEDLHRKTKPAFDRENTELEAFKAAATGTAPARLKPWEFAYWSEKQRRAKYDFDSEALRPYLPVSGVENGMYRIAEKIFGITVKQRDTLADGKVLRAPDVNRTEGAPIEVWHPEVKFFEIFDGATQLGSFYADWFPRESKRGGAWMNFLVTGGPKAGGSFAPHLGLMVGNFTPPVGDKEALISHDEAVTIFHEFGHLLHHLLCTVEIESLAGTRVAWDFVELPSQILENWCWHKESLDLFARHHETDAPLPDDLLAKLVKAGNYRAATAMMGQLANGKLDLDIHTRAADFAGRDLDEYWNTDIAAYQAPATETGTCIARRFTHIFGDPTGYAAGYYSYKWAEALDADAFTRFTKEGILNPATGRAFRDCVLAKGNSEAPDKLFRDFMGRDPDPVALLRRDGLA